MGNTQTSSSSSSSSPCSSSFSSSSCSSSSSPTRKRSASTYSTFGHPPGTARTRSVSSPPTCVPHLVRQLLPHDTLPSLALQYRSDKAQLKHCNRLYDDTIAHLKYLLIPASSSISVSQRNIRIHVRIPTRDRDRDRDRGARRASRASRGETEPFVTVSEDALVLVGFNNSPFDDPAAERLDIRVPYSDIASVVVHDHGCKPVGVVCVAPYKNSYYVDTQHEVTREGEVEGEVEEVEEFVVGQEEEEEEEEGQRKGKKRRCKEAVLVRLKAFKVPLLVWATDASRLVSRVQRHLAQLHR